MKKFTILLLLFCISLLRAQGLQNTTKEVTLKGNYTIKNIAVNTKYQDYGVSYAGDSTVIFTSSRKSKTIKNRVWKGNDQPFLQLYKGVCSEDGEISEVTLFSKKVNSKFHDADVTFSKDLKTIYFTRNNYLNKKFKKDTLNRNLNQLYKAKIKNKDDWEVKQMPFNNDNYQTGHPVLNAAEDKLYFISDMLGGYGETDIYVVDILNDSTYSAPRNLGPNVNTQGKEMFPFVDENDVLYFSSNGYVDGKGGLDIYVAPIQHGEVVKKAQNIGEPLNSNKDDFSFVQKPNTNLGYFSSNRDGGNGDDDIYSFVELTPLTFKCNQLVQGVIRDKNTNELLPGALVELFDHQGVLLESKITDANATFSFNLNCETNYKLVGSEKDYTIDDEEISTSNVYNSEFKVDLNLAISEFVYVRDSLMIKINPLYFDLNKSYIRSDAAVELEKVVAIMRKYPEIKIQLNSHTDSRAPDAYNLKLSNRRAKSSIDWIIKKGIDPSRITGQGYGETQLVNKCSNDVPCTEAEHQLNRRTEFVIVNPEAIK
ncbi:WD40-like Beta Propeller Repeat [Lutibacter agarilyticus]|uniref:WD40-like Beta Propeller Repeat n=1 Tax=Lutibacter agarilyticus TaxID=1109740 RepID=A0A238XGY4_9FLAO|nr:OmpA family protein [Lutibacter agarilyticus]SNR57179.1 WD40-like Beta Propeller Repeat [Lutibacter agarilyticus]